MAADETRSGRPGLDPRAVSLRRMHEADLALMHRWLNAPHVARWWYGEGTSRREIEAEYLPLIEGQDPASPYVILYRDIPIGYAQTYEVSHEEGYARLVGVEHSVGIDLFIGEAEYLHRGLGPYVLRRLLAEAVFSDPGVEVCVIGPEPKNAAAVRSYEKVGFRYFKTIQVPGEPEPEHLMKITRREFEGSRMQKSTAEGRR